MKIYKEPGQEPVFLLEENTDTHVLLVKAEHGEWPATIRHLIETDLVGEPETYNRLINAALALWGKEMYDKGQEEGMKSGWDLSREEKESSVGGGFF